MAKQKNPSPKAYTVDELENMIDSAEKRIVTLQKRIKKIEPFLNKAQAEYLELVINKTELEHELKRYSGFFANFKSSITAAFSGKEKVENAVKTQICQDLEEINALLDEKTNEVKWFEDAIALNEHQIEVCKHTAERWSKKRDKKLGTPNDVAEKSIE